MLPSTWSTVAQHPFNDIRADLILRSSDGIDFGVFRGILYMASPAVLASKVEDALQHAPSEPFPVVSMPETSHILDRLLRLLYPIHNPYLDTCSLDDVRDVLHAALSYQMAIAIKTMRGRLAELLESDPGSVYAVACWCNLEAEARDAAKRLVDKNIADVKAIQLTQWSYVSAASYLRLLRYLRARGTEPLQWPSSLLLDPNGPASFPTTTTGQMEVEIPKKVAASPFDGTMAGDIILLSSDGVLFHIHRVILSMASPVFRDMFAMPQPAADTTVAAPIPVAESASALDRVLRICYPVADPVADDLAVVAEALRTADKYDVVAASAWARRELRRLMPGEPLRAYAISCMFGLQEEGRAAAAASLSLSFSEVEAMSEVPELLQVSAATLSRLFAYRRTCRDAVVALTAGYAWVPINQISLLQCIHCSSPDGVLGQFLCPRVSWRACLDAARTALAERPGYTNIAAMLERELSSKSVNKPECRHSWNDDRALVEVFSKKIDSTIAGVSLQIGC